MVHGDMCVQEKRVLWKALEGSGTCLVGLPAPKEILRLYTTQRCSDFPASLEIQQTLEPDSEF